MRLISKSQRGKNAAPDRNWAARVRPILHVPWLKKIPAYYRNFKDLAKAPRCPHVAR